jgi:hypothetical protein
MAVAIVEAGIGGRIDFVQAASRQRRDENEQKSRSRRALRPADAGFNERHAALFSHLLMSPHHRPLSHE